MTKQEAKMATYIDEFDQKLTNSCCITDLFLFIRGNEFVLWDLRVQDVCFDSSIKIQIEFYQENPLSGTYKYSFNYNYDKKTKLNC